MTISGITIKAGILKHLPLKFQFSIGFPAFNIFAKLSLKSIAAWWSEPYPPITTKNMHRNGDKSSFSFGFYFSNFSGLISRCTIFIESLKIAISLSRAPSICPTYGGGLAYPHADLHFVSQQVCFSDMICYLLIMYVSIYLIYSSCFVFFHILLQMNVAVSNFFVSAMCPRCPQGLSMQLPSHGPSLEELPDGDCHGYCKV